MKQAKRQKSERQGRWAETLATIFLTLKGYRIIRRRFKAKGGEVDLVASQGKSTIFIEVKWRRTIEAAAASVLPRQRARIEQAAKYFMISERYSEDRSIRFDVVALAPGRWPRHIKGAWRPNRPD